VVEGDVKGRLGWRVREFLGNLMLLFAWAFPIVSALLRGSFILANHQISPGSLVLNCDFGIKVANSMLVPNPVRARGFSLQNPGVGVKLWHNESHGIGF
jgi:hypothetical protein